MVALWHQLDTATLMFVIVPTIVMIANGFDKHD